MNTFISSLKQNCYFSGTYKEKRKCLVSLTRKRKSEELLMRPVRITALMNELAALRTANVISANTGSDVANLIFNEIQAQTQPMRDDWQTLIDDVKDYSRHLYQTTDELNDHMRTSVNLYK